MSQIQVSIVMGSESDVPVMKKCSEVLDNFAVLYEMKILSAHRMPEATSDYAKRIEKRGIKVVIAGAGGAAHLPGTIAAHTIIPVIGVPLASSNLQGLDALYSIVQMPAGVPVACMAIGAAGAKNAAILAVKILSLSSSELKERMEKYKARLAQGSK